MEFRDAIQCGGRKVDAGCPDLDVCPVCRREEVGDKRGFRGYGPAGGDLFVARVGWLVVEGEYVGGQKSYGLKKQELDSKQTASKRR